MNWGTLNHAALAAAFALTACVSESVLPEPSPGSVTARATEACSRKMAQMAAAYKPKDLTAFLVEEAHPLADGSFFVALLVSINYPNETRTARVNCTVDSRGGVRSIAEPTSRVL